MTFGVGNGGTLRSVKKEWMRVITRYDYGSFNDCLVGLLLGTIIPSRFAQDCMHHQKAKENYLCISNGC